MVFSESTVSVLPAKVLRKETDMAERPVDLMHRSAWGIARHLWPAAVLALAGALLLGGCARDYVSGRPTFSLIDEEQEIALGREQDAQVVAQYGLYDDRDLAVYVEDLGQSLAAVSQRAELKYHYRVLDDDEVNAFALPGGYIYLPRGILAYFNSEDQLAGVMAHETAHVVARHGPTWLRATAWNRCRSGFSLLDSV
jgi:predicted Zn-dependent protease